MSKSTPKPCPNPKCGMPARVIRFADSASQVSCSETGCTMRYAHLPLDEWNAWPRSSSVEPLGELFCSVDDRHKIKGLIAHIEREDVGADWPAVAALLRDFVDHAPLSPDAWPRVSEAPSAETLAKGWFSYGLEMGFERHATESEALARAKSLLELCREDASDGGWPDGMETICYGRVCGAVHETERMPWSQHLVAHRGYEAEDIAGDSSDFEEFVDYGLFRASSSTDAALVEALEDLASRIEGLDAKAASEFTLASEADVIRNHRRIWAKDARTLAYAITK